MNKSKIRFTRSQILVIALFVVIGGLVRFFQLGNESLWFDESLSVLFASQPFDISIQSMLEEGLQHSPLYYLLLRSFVSNPVSEFSVRSLSVIVGVVSIPFMAILGKELFSARTGIFAAALLAINPFHVWYSREARMYTLLAFVALGTMYFFAKLIFRKEKVLRYWLFLSLFLAIGFNTHHFAFFLPLIQLIFIIATFKSSYMIIRQWVGSLLIGALAFVPWIVVALDSGVYWATSGTPDQTTQFIDIPLTFWNFSIGYTEKLNMLVLLSLLSFSFLLIRGLFAARREKLLLVLWLLVPVIFTSIISLRFPMYMDRYLIISLPAFIIGIAHGLDSIQISKYRWLGIGFVFTVTLCSLARIYFDRNTYDRADWRALGGFLEENVNPARDTVATVYYQNLIPLLFYYDGDVSIDPIISNRIVSIPEVDATKSYQEMGYFWLIIPHPNRTNHLVGHCQDFRKEPFTDREDVLDWREDQSPRLSKVFQFTCIRLERYEQ